MLAGPALSAFAIFHSSECADVVNVPGGNEAVAEERSSAKAIEDIAAKPIAATRAVVVGVCMDRIHCSKRAND